MSFYSVIRQSTPVEFFRKLTPNSMVNVCKHLPMSIMANIYYGFPSRNLKVIGVTGTDGKTTTATMLYHILHKNGFKVALISTVSAKVGSKDIDTGFHVTSPDHFPMQRLLRAIADHGFTHVVLEVTSHGLEQYRLLGVKFTGGIVTNITEDHLDYHKTWTKYASAKAKLFRKTKFSVINIEDKSYAFLKNKVSGKLVTYGLEKGDWNLSEFPIKLQVLGTFNYANALAASAAASELGVSKEQIQQAMTSFYGVVGRMQVLHADPKVIVDFAHTPNGLKSALSTLKDDNTGKLIAIFGCAGQRDKNRRKMGKVAAQLADVTIITAEDPRNESVEHISADIAVWAKKGGGVSVSQEDILKHKRFKHPVYVAIADRQEAIDFGLKIAQKEDVVGIFGKGHEKTMCFGNTEIPWTDQEAVKKSLKNSYS